MSAPILVPVDGSPFSEQAIPIACDIARRTRAPVHLVQVHTFMHPVAYPEIMPPYDPDWETALRIHQRNHLTKLRHDVEETYGIETHAALIEGRIVDALVHYAEARETGFIVMTTHGRGGLSRAWLGSVASELSRFVRVPVLLVRPKQLALPILDLSGVKHVLVPLDGSLLSESILPQAAAMAKLSDASVTLLQVTDGDGHYLERVATRLRALELDVDVAVVQHWQPAHAIIDYAAAHAVDLIAMATHGRGAWSRWVIGSVADKVIRGCQIPALVLRPVEALGEPVFSVGGSDAEHAYHT